MTFEEFEALQEPGLGSHDDLLGMSPSPGWNLMSNVARIGFGALQMPFPARWPNALRDIGGGGYDAVMNGLQLTGRHPTQGVQNNLLGLMGPYVDGANWQEPTLPSELAYAYDRRNDPISQYLRDGSNQDGRSAMLGSGLTLGGLLMALSKLHPVGRAGGLALAATGGAPIGMYGPSAVKKANALSKFHNFDNRSRDLASQVHDGTGM